MVGATMNHCLGSSQNFRVPLKENVGLTGTLGDFGFLLVMTSIFLTLFAGKILPMCITTYHPYMVLTFQTFVSIALFDVRAQFLTYNAMHKSNPKIPGMFLSFPYMLDEAETTPRRMSDTFVREPGIRLLEQVPPVANVALAAVETGCHDEIRVPERTRVSVFNILDNRDYDTLDKRKGQGRCSQREFLRPRRLRFLGQHHFENQDPRALPHRGN